VIKQKANKIFNIIFVSRAIYKRVVLFGFGSLKKMKAEAVLFFGCTYKKSASSASASLL